MSQQYPVPEQTTSALILRPENQLAPYVVQAPANEIDDSLHLRDLLRIVLKRKWWILSVALVMLIGATLVTLMETPLYRATTTIQIDRVAQRVVDYRDASGVAEQIFDDGQFFQTQIELLRSKALAERVMETLRLDIDRKPNTGLAAAVGAPKSNSTVLSERDDWIGKIFTTLRKRNEPSVQDTRLLDRESILGSLRGSMQVEPVPNSRLVRIHVTGADPSLAARMANTWSEAYTKSNLEHKVNASSYARTFLEQELAKSKVRLEESENSLVQYTRQKQMLGGDEKANPLTVNFADFSAALAKAIGSHDAVFSAAHFATVPPEAVIGPVKQAHVPRLMVVGGAGSLRVPGGARVIDSPDFPEAYKAEAAAGGQFLDALLAEPALNWTFLSPSAEFVEGPRTGHFRLGKDDLLVSAEGRSWISFADFAIAFLDEFERPQHARERFTVGY